MECFIIQTHIPANFRIIFTDSFLIYSNYDVHRECTKSSVLADCGSEAADVAEEIVLISGGDIVSYYCSNHTIFSETCQRLVPDQIAAVVSAASSLTHHSVLILHTLFAITIIVPLLLGIGSEFCSSSKLILAVIASSTIQLMLLLILGREDEHYHRDHVTSRSIAVITINLVLMLLLVFPSSWPKSFPWLSCT